MPINKPTLSATPALLADWIEIRTIADPAGFYRVSNLKRYWDVNRETELSDPEGHQREEKYTDGDGVSGGDEEKFLDAVLQELSERVVSLEESYPFEFEKSGIRFALKKNLSEGAYAYLFCLLLSHCKAGEIMSGRFLPTIDHEVRDWFQACATLAAAGIVNGCSISFGWPRPNNNASFLTALTSVYAKFGEGEVVKAPRRGAPIRIKDGAIDVIAWKPRRDKAPGTTYYLGQVASGKNWTYKSIKGGPIEAFHQNWFTRIPASTVTPSIFIPTVILPEKDESRSERMQILSPEFGHMFDRLSLPRYTDEGIALADHKNNKFHIERRKDMPKITKWVMAQLKSIRKAGKEGLP